MSTTSGLGRARVRRPRCRREAVPTTSTPSIRPTSIASPSRTTRWSSAISTRIDGAVTPGSPTRRASPTRSGRRSGCRRPVPLVRACPTAPGPRRRRLSPSGDDASTRTVSSTVSIVRSPSYRSTTRRHRPGRIANDVRQRFLRAAVEREARVGRERPRVAFDRQRDVRVHVGPEARDERLELIDAGQVVASERADGLTGTGKPVPDQFAGTVDRRTHLGARVLPLGQLPRALQLNRGARRARGRGRRGARSRSDRAR